MEAIKTASTVDHHLLHREAHFISYKGFHIIYSRNNSVASRLTMPCFLNTTIMPWLSRSQIGLLLTIFMLLLVHSEPQFIQSASYAPMSSCSSNILWNYESCVAQNPCTCSNCDPNPMDNYPEIHLAQPPSNCRDVNRLFCPLIRCCSPCAEQALMWYSCAMEDFSQQILGQNCTQLCSSFPFNDASSCNQTSPQPSQIDYNFNQGSGTTVSPISPISNHWVQTKAPATQAVIQPVNKTSVPMSTRAPLTASSTFQASSAFSVDRVAGLSSVPVALLLSQLLLMRM